MPKNKKNIKLGTAQKNINMDTPQKNADSPTSTLASVVGKFSNLITKKNIFIGIAAILFIAMYIQIQNIFGTFSFLQGRDSSLITEIGQIKESYSNIGHDLNEVRDYLRLPTKSYSEFAEPGEIETKNSIEMSLFKYADFLIYSKNLEKSIAKYASFLENLRTSAGFANFLAQENLTISKIINDDSGYSLNILGPNSESVVFFFLGKDDGILYFKTINEKEETDSKTYEEFEKDTTEFLKGNKSKIIEKITSLNAKRKEIASTINSPETQKAIKELKISISLDYLDNNLKNTYTVFNRNAEVIGEITLETDSLEIYLVDKNDDSLSLQVTDISASLVPFLKKLDTKTLLEKKAEQALSELNNTVNDKGFQLLLSQNNLTITPGPREKDGKYYYDIFDSDGNLVSSIAAEKATGIISIAAPDGSTNENLLTFDPDYKKKTLEIPDVIPDYGDTLAKKDGTLNILIGGKNGSLIDTMIFAHINENSRTIRMISIPRDLFYNGRKINSFAAYYGLSELKKVISKIAGYELDKYIVIDMYAFIDVVNLIGGIDIHLDQAVVDPTYRTIDNGVEGTLHYEPGDYHLGGKEALRLARSRHTSSDFARAERQQKILKAVQNKAQNFGFGDVSTIYEIAKSILSKTETDITLDEAVAYYFRYKNFKIETNNVISSGNILYVPPYITEENCQTMIAEAELKTEPKPDCEDKNHAYTLLPKDNNWNIIKWFFRGKFEAE